MRRAAALPVALFTLAIASALSVGGLYVARTLAASTHTALRGSDLELRAESFLVLAMANWDSAQRASQQIGSTAALAPSGDSRVKASGWITRTSELDYWAVAEAAAPANPMIRRRLGLSLRSENGRPRLASPRAWGELP